MRGATNNGRSVTPQRQAPPGASVPVCVEGLRIEASMPYETATHYAIAKALLDGGALSGVAQQEAEALVREWRSWSRHPTFVRHWRAGAGML